MQKSKTNKTTRWLFLAFIVALFLIGGFFLYSRLPQGYIVPVRIAGHSMAKRFNGDHVSIDCPDCGITHRIDSIPETHQLICSHCQSTIQVAEYNATLVAAERVLIDKQILRKRTPERWEVVALDDPLKPGRRIVKRIIGLPGETIEIDRGELQITNPTEQISMATEVFAMNSRMLVLVNDDIYRGSKSGSRWQNVGVDEESGAAKWEAASMKHRIDATELSDPQWLTYQHPNTHPGTEQHVIYDDDIYNVSMNRQLHASASVVVSGRVLLEGDGLFLLKCDADDRQVVIEFDTTKMTCRMNDSEPLPLASREFWFRVHQQRSGVSLRSGPMPRSGKQELITQLTLPSSKSPGLARFSVGASGLSATVSHLRVERAPSISIDSPMPALAISWKLLADEYFLLGDNSPVSVDSRHWPKMVRAADIIGIVRHKD